MGTNQQITTLLVQERFSHQALDELALNLKNGFYRIQWTSPNGGRTLECYVKVWRGNWKCVGTIFFDNL